MMDTISSTLTFAQRVERACERIQNALKKADRFPVERGKKRCVIIGDSRHLELIVSPHASDETPALKGLRLAINSGYLVMRLPGNCGVTYAPFDIMRPDCHDEAPAIALQLEHLADEVERWERSRSSAI